MKKHLSLSVFFCLSFHCFISAQQGWTELNGVGISQPASQIPHNISGTNGFRIGNEGFLGTGYVDHVFSDYPSNDLFSYDIPGNHWQHVASLPSFGRSSGIAYQINGKGYFGFGVSDTTVLKDIWEYDATSDSWTQKTDFPGLPRREATYFSNNGKGYVTGGYKYVNATFTYYHDCWEFDPVANSWNQKSDFPLASVSGGATFTINQYSYLTGFQNAGIPVNTTYRYDQPSDSWDTVATGPLSQARFGFSLGDSGYVVNYNQLFLYDPVSNQWSSRANLPYPANMRNAITLNNLAYLENGDGDVLEYNSTSDTWIHQYRSPASYDEPFSHAITIGDTAYSGMWKYDFNSDLWKVDSALLHANWLFSIGDSGYALIDPYPLASSFQVYDPVSRMWTLLPPVSLKSAWIYFSLLGKGYFGMGTDSLCPAGNSFYEYDPATSQWTRKSDFPGAAAFGVSCFKFQDKGYVAGGVNNGSDTLTELWQYDPLVDMWSQKASTPGTCIGCLSVENNSKVYYGFGVQYSDGGPDYSYFNYYDPIANTWSANLYSPFGGHGAIGFSKDNHLYIGRSAIYYSHPYSDQLFGFYRYEDHDGILENDFESISIYPNPSSSKIFISGIPQFSVLKIYDCNGKEQYNQTIPKNNSLVDLQSYSSGVYFVSLQTKEGSVVKKIIKE